MEFTHVPYTDPDIKMLIERMNPPRVSIDNDACPLCTVVKVDSANKHGMLLEMVQILTDLDLLISRSYISSDGGWLMDVFHVTDQQGNKIRDENLLQYIQQAITTSREHSSMSQTCVRSECRPQYISPELTAFEITGIDRPGIMSEMSAVLAELGCRVSATVAWTHNKRAACILYVEDEAKSGPITDPCRVSQMKSHLENVVEAHHFQGEKRSVRLVPPVSGRTHTERRLHQLMASDGDYEVGSSSCCNSDSDDEEIFHRGGRKKRCYATHVKIDKCGGKDYSIVTIRCRDRPKLLFDTVCALTDMNYVVFHAAIRSKSSRAIQEYYIRHKDGHTLESESERHRVVQCLTAATERRISCGVRLDIKTENRVGLLSDVTRAIRENGLSIVRAELGTCSGKAIGTFYVADASGQSIDEKALEMVKQDIGDIIVADDNSTDSSVESTSPSIKSSSSSNDFIADKAERPWFSLGSLFWTQLEKLVKQS